MATMVVDTVRNVQVITSQTTVIVGEKGLIHVQSEMKISDIPPAIWGVLAAYEVR